MMIAMHSTARPLWLMVVLATDTTSGYPTATAKDEFFVRFRYWLVNGGMITRKACGSTTKFIVCCGVSPRALAASV